MDLDDFKYSAQKFLPNKSLADGFLIKQPEDLAAEIALGIKKHRQKLIAVILVHITLAIIYFNIISVARQNTETGYIILGTGCLLAASYLLFKYNSLKDSVFQLPTYEFICRAEKHFIYMRKSDFIISALLVIVLGIGGGLVFVNNILYYTNNATLLIIIWCVFFVSLSVFGFYAGRKDWQKENGKLILDLKNFRENMTSIKSDKT